MKYRLGFVANSSSASYYVTIRGPQKETFDAISNYCGWPYFDTQRINIEIDKNIANLRARIEDIESKKESFLVIHTKSDLEEKIVTLKSYKNTINKITRDRNSDKISWTDRNDEVAKIVIILNHIEIEPSKEDEVKLSSSTVMHNSYVEGMPNLLKDIVLYYTFEQSDKISLHVDHDN